MAENESPEPMSLAQAGQPTKRDVPGATAFIPPQHDPKDPAYEVVGNLGYFDGTLHAVGTVIRTTLPKKAGLGSPSESLKPLGHKGKWPPATYMEEKRKAEKAARDERLKDFMHGF